MNKDILQAARAEYLRRDFWAFFLEAWNILEPDTEIIVNWHMKYIARVAQKIVEDTIEKKPKEKDFIFNVPPGSTKSTMLTICLQPWAWLTKPSLRFITSSWDGTLAINHALKSRDLINSTWYQETFVPEWRIKHDKNKKSEFENTATGVRIATSVGGTIIGRHADIQIGDDLNTPEKAISKEELEKVNRWWDTTMSSRVTGKHARRIVIQQRIHQKDLTGYVLKEKPGKYSHVCIPAQLGKKYRPVPEGLERYYKNGLMDPVRLDFETLQRKKIELGSTQYAGQMGQSPSPEEGNKFNREWFPKVSIDMVPKFLRRNLWIDGAYTKNTQDDPTGLMVTCFDANKNRLYIVHRTDKYMEMPELLKFVPPYHDLYCDHRSRVYIEPKASGKSLKQLLKDGTHLNAIEIKSYIVQEGKEARADAASPFCEAGRVFVVEGPWNEDFFDQLETFPNAEHDEDVDNMCYAIHYHFVGRKRKKVRKLN